jgi:hypothetical protein
LTDDALSLALDGFADEDTQRHLAQCPACAARLEDMRLFDNRLRGRLRRFECPPPQQLIEYQLKMLSGDEAERVKKHVADCPRCQRDLAELDGFLNLQDEEPIPDNIIPLWTPRNMFKAAHVQTAGNLALKGLDDENTHDAKAGSATVLLESKAVPKGFQLTGQILDDQVDWAGAVVEVWQDGAPQQVSTLDETCEFRFDFTAATSVDLYFTAPSGVTLVVESVTIQP